MNNEEKRKIGLRIKRLRKEKNMTMKILGEKVNLHESTISRYEKGLIQSLDIEKMKELADVLNTTPTYLMGWDEKVKHWDNTIDTKKLSEQVKTLDLVEKHHGKDAVQLLHNFDQLNELGKEKALETLNDLIEIPKYKISTR